MLGMFHKEHKWHLGRKCRYVRVFRGLQQFPQSADRPAGLQFGTGPGAESLAQHHVAQVADLLHG